MPGYDEFGSPADTLDAHAVHLPNDGEPIGLDELLSFAAHEQAMRLTTSPRSRAVDMVSGQMLSFTFEVGDDGIYDPSKNKPNPAFTEAIERHMIRDYRDWCRMLIEAIAPPEGGLAHMADDIYEVADSDGRKDFLLSVQDGTLVAMEVLAHDDAMPNFMVVFEPTEDDEFDFPHILVAEPDLKNDGGEGVYTPDMIFEEELYRIQFEECFGLEREYRS